MEAAEETTQEKDLAQKRHYWGPVAATLWPILLFLASQLTVALLFGVYSAIRHMPNSQTNDWVTNSIPAQFVYLALAESFVLTAIWLLLKHYKAGVKVIGLLKPRLKDLPIALIGFAVYFVAFIVIIAVLQQLIPSLKVDQKQNIGFDNATSAVHLMLAFISLVIIPPITEEILFRGFAFTGFRRKFGFVIATLATSILFAIPHLLESKGGGPLWIAGIDTFILSFVLCYLREKTGRLVPGMGVHALKNLVAFISLFILQTH